MTRFRPPLGPAFGSTLRSRTGRDPAVLRLADREGDRLGRRPARRDRPRRCARSTSSTVEGIPTTRELALDVLRSDGFRPGAYSTGYLDEMEAHPPVAAARRAGGNAQPLGRRQARRQALFLLYQWDLTGSRSRRSSRATRTSSPRARRGGRGAGGGARRARSPRASEGWPADRLGTLERNILRIGVYELEEETVPAEVAINEAVGAREALRDRGRRAARERDPRARRSGRSAA